MESVVVGEAGAANFSILGGKSAVNGVMVDARRRDLVRKFEVKGRLRLGGSFVDAPGERLV